MTQCRAAELVETRALSQRVAELPVDVTLDAARVLTALEQVFRSGAEVPVIDMFASQPNVDTSNLLFNLGAAQFVSLELPRFLLAPIAQQSNIPMLTTQTGTASSTTPLVSADLALDQAYVVENRSAVYKFIRHNKLRPLLLRAIEPLKLCFGESPLKVLKIFTDEDGSETLVCRVAMSGSLDSARTSLARFDDTWWSANYVAAGEKLDFDYDLV